jgi:hypothetical protein
MKFLVDFITSLDDAVIRYNLEEQMRKANSPIISVRTSNLDPNNLKLMDQVVVSLRTWDHEGAKGPWILLIESYSQTYGAIGDLEIKYLIWHAIRKACLTCASRGENEFMRLVENLVDTNNYDDLGRIESQSTIDKEHQLDQMVFNISKKLYDSATAVSRINS